MNNTIIIIPARMASTRLPGKPLVDLAGKPMIAQVVNRGLEANCGPVLVACDDQKVAAASKNAGAEAIMTRADHASGSDRIVEALEAFDPKGTYDYVINLQGDLPTISKDAIQKVLEPLLNSDADIATLAVKIEDEAEKSNPNVVKPIVAWNENETSGRALYFTRTTAPHGEGDLYHHIGIYAYKRKSLIRFTKLSPSPLEQREKLEQLRALENGMKIQVVRIAEEPLGVDTPEDAEKARKVLNS